MFSNYTETRILEEDVKTGGHYQADDLEMDVLDQAGWQTKAFIWPFPISVMEAQILISSTMEGDNVRAQINPGFQYGVVTSAVAVNDTVLNVNSTVLDNCFIGMKAEVDGEALGRIVAVDTQNSQVTVETAATQTHDAMTAFKATIEMVRPLGLPTSGRYVIGGAKIGGSYMPAGVPLVIGYENLTGGAKKFRALLEYLY